MSSNPFKIFDDVSGDFEVEKDSTEIKCEIKNLKLKWRIIDMYDMEVLTLDEILSQITKMTSIKNGEIGLTPFIRVAYESGMWGVIFEVGNYTEKGNQWIVHGVTKGYA